MNDIYSVSVSVSSSSSSPISSTSSRLSASSSPCNLFLVRSFFSVLHGTLILCFGLCYLGLSGCSKGDKASAPAAIEIPVAQVEKKDIPISYEYVGQTSGAIDAEVRARVEGVITGIHFEEGKVVQEGQPIYTIDPAPFEAKLAEANGKLAEAKTKLVKAANDLMRVKPLVEMKALSKRDLDAAVANEGSAKGLVDAAQANVKSAEIELGYTKILAPISGTIGLSKAKVGEFVGKAPNPVVLNTVSKMDPIHVRIAISEKDYLFFAQKKQKQIEAGETPQKRTLELLLADGSSHSHKGMVESIDSKIDPKTGSLTVEAAFPNPNELIKPGQFARVRSQGDVRQGALVVPKRAVTELQGRYQVWVVGQDNTVEQREVKLGPVHEKLQVIESGVDERDRIAVEGLQRLRPGLAIQPKVILEGEAQG